MCNVIDPLLKNVSGVCVCVCVLCVCVCVCVYVCVCVCVCVCESSVHMCAIAH